MSRPEVVPQHTSDSTGTSRWMVVIYNNEVNTFDEVIAVLMLATGCTAHEAAIEAWEAHTYGKAPVHFGVRDVCEEAAAIIGRIGVRAEVCEEWPEG